MKPLPLTPELERVARRCVWFKEPREALADTPEFLAYVLTYGTHEDVKAVRRHVTDMELTEALDHAPPGVFDGRSWAYWNLKLGRYPAPPFPERRL